MTAEVERFFSEQSPLATEVASFRPRTQQREMALAVAEAIRDNAILVAEAGTGTGKTFAYLAPALSLLASAAERRTRQPRPV